MWFGNKCKICRNRLGKEFNILKIQTSEGIKELKICDSCADDMDQMRKLNLGDNYDESV
jgi:hypothetical protein